MRFNTRIALFVLRLQRGREIDLTGCRVYDRSVGNGRYYNADRKRLTLDGMIGGPEGSLKSRFAMPCRAYSCGKSHSPTESVKLFESELTAAQSYQERPHLVTVGVQSACYSDKLELGSSMSTIADSPHSSDACLTDGVIIEAGEKRRTCPPFSNSSSQYTRTGVTSSSRQAPLAQESEKGKKPRSQILVEVCRTFNQCTSQHARAACAWLLVAPSSQQGELMQSTSSIPRVRTESGGMKDDMSETFNQCGRTRRTEEQFGNFSGYHDSPRAGR
ncbi:hypothetical protein BDN71DRAFT_1435646 [Pleurotus eryngii]|uniref:Uncharacterized protein n=1 Tax=Pleurotus eryngii TaxID=5323 RepID=A0A9P5ZKU2_PLEER|nr:hypothetical protein BDN71DRAFT_1435646 [Pleurotus eryngii]